MGPGAKEEGGCDSQEGEDGGRGSRVGEQFRFWTDFVGGTHKVFGQIGCGCEGKREVKDNSKVSCLNH